MADEQSFFVAQKALIEKDSKVLVLFDSNGLDFPGGKIQEGEEDFEKSLRREVEEETNLEIEIGQPFVVWCFISRNHNPQTHGKKVFAVGYKCSYKSGELKLSDEHERFEWVNKESYKKIDDGSEFFKVLQKYFNC